VATRVDGDVAASRGAAPTWGVTSLDGRRVVRVTVGSPGGRTGRPGLDGEAITGAAHRAAELRLPIVVELGAAGVDASERVDALHAWGQGARALTRCSGLVPVVALVNGPVVSGSALLLGLADLVVMGPSAVAFVSDPDAVARFTGVRLDAARLGGTSVHASTSGLCSIDAEDGLDAVVELLGYLPDSCDQLPPVTPAGRSTAARDEDLREVVPAGARSSYDVRAVIAAVTDEGSLLELSPRWAGQLVTALARVDGRPVGVLANQPQTLAGTLDIAASQKGARFVRFCDAFNLPLVTLVDTPGFLPGKDLEWRGMIRHGAELAFAYAEATVPRVCLIVRKAFGGAYIVMDSKGLGNDVCLAWPGSEIAVMGAPGAVQILYRGAGPEERAELEARYRQDLLTPWAAAQRGFVDMVVDPAETSGALRSALASLCTKREALAPRKHDQGPL